MANREAILRQSDLARYAKAMKQAGLEEWRVIVRPDGSHEIIAGKVDSNTSGPDPDELLR